MEIKDMNTLAVAGEKGEIVNEEDLTLYILRYRGEQVMLDRDLARLYGVDTKVLNQAVKRNIERFPKGFRFQLSKDEFSQLVTNCDRFEKLKHSSSLPYAFTEQGVATGGFGEGHGARAVYGDSAWILSGGCAG